MKTKQFFLIFLAVSSFTFNTFGSLRCADLRSRQVDLERIIEPIFYNPSSNQHSSFLKLLDQAQKTSPEQMTEKRTILRKEAGYAAEPIPLIIRKNVWLKLRAAAEQRTLAANRFLLDVYRSHDPLFLKAHPEFKPILESSPLFAQEIVGSKTSLHDPFNFTLAMDFVLTKNPDGTERFAILEADSGSIGGNFRMAMLAQGLDLAWPQVRLWNDFLDPRKSLFDRIERHTQNAKAFSDAPNGRSLLFKEAEQALDPHHDSAIQRWLKERNVLLASRWNRDDLIYDEVKKRYYYQGYPITDFWLEYYTEPLDPKSPVYSRLPESMKTDPFELAHTLPGHWSRWQENGYQRWSQSNSQGIEVFTDKAIAAAIPLAEKLYLGKKPALSGNSYSNILQRNPKETRGFIEKIFADQDNSVIKSRRESGQGLGVYIGRFLKNGKTKGGISWAELKKMVLADPIEWVYQPFLEELPLTLADGRQRTFEMRIITNFENGVPHVIEAVYIRSSELGTMRNMSGSKDRQDLNAPSIVPVLIPK